MELVSVVLASETPTSQYTDTASLLDFGFDNFSIYNVSGSNFKDMADSPFFTNYSSLYSTENPLISASGGNIVLPNSVDISEVEKQVTYNTQTELQEGPNKIGTVTYTYNDKIVGQTSIIYNNTKTEQLPTIISSVIPSTTPTTKPSTSTVVTEKRNLKPFIITGIIVVISILVLLYYFLIHQIRRRRSYYRHSYSRKTKSRNYRRRR